jgi:hypothetical protein
MKALWVEDWRYSRAEVKTFAQYVEAISKGGFRFHVPGFKILDYTFQMNIFRLKREELRVGFF